MPGYTEAEQEAYQRGREDGILAAGKEWGPTLAEVAKLREDLRLTEIALANYRARVEELERSPVAELRIGDTTFVRRGNQWERKT